MGEFDRWPKQIPVQPGEWVTGCGHTAHAPIVPTAPDPANTWRWFELSPPAAIASVEGNFTSRWTVVCAACLRAAGGKVGAVPIAEHWRMAETIDDHVQRVRLLGDDRDAIHSYLCGLDGEQLLAVAAAIGLTEAV